MQVECSLTPPMNSLLSTHCTTLLIHITVVCLYQESCHWKVTLLSGQHQWGTTTLRIKWDMVNTVHRQQLERITQCVYVCICIYCMHSIFSMNHTRVHNEMYHSTTHCSPQAEVKSTLVHEVRHHWEATTENCIVKACPTIFIHLEHPLSKEGQQVLHTLKGSTIGSLVKGSG